MSEASSTRVDRTREDMTPRPVPQDSGSGSIRKRNVMFLSCGAICLLLAEPMFSLPPTLYAVIQQEVQEVGREEEPREQQQPYETIIEATKMQIPDTASYENPRLKPWESTPPTPISLMKGTTHDYIKRRHTCIQAIRAHHQDIFKDYLVDDNGANRDVLLVDPAYHDNVGDHMLTLGEIRMIEETLIEETFKLPSMSQCHYEQARKFVAPCEKVLTQGRSSNSTSGKVAFWHAGGNWGDLYRGMFLLMMRHLPWFQLFLCLSILLVPRSL
jgi:hypothetical protein